MHVLKWIIGSAFGVAGVGLIAFGPRAHQAMPGNVVVVDYWEKWTGNEEEQMRVIVDDFNKTVGKEKGIFVRYVSTSAINQKVLVATAAGVPPDIAGLYDNNLVQFAAMDALEPLEDLAREHGITAPYYKKVYWDALTYEGHLYALISTPMSVALHYNKQALADSADALRAAGLDPTRPPQTIAELDAYAKILDVRDANGTVTRTGFLPMEPNWFINYTCFWFGGSFWDPVHEKFTLTDPKVVAGYKWIESYSKRLGKDAMTNFQSGFGNFDSPQNAFLADQTAMELQGPWMANFIYKLKPSMSTLKWPKEEELKMPLAERRENYSWAVAPFPSVDASLPNVTYIGFDAMTIPRGAKHKREAFEFIAYVNRQDVMEKLNKLHCKNSPLEKVSDGFYADHPNPYVDVFDALARSPNAVAIPKIPIMPEVLAEMTNLAQSVSLLQVEPEAGLREIQERLQAHYDQFARLQRDRRGKSGG